MNEQEQFLARNRTVIEQIGGDADLKAITRDWFARVSKLEYSYHFSWLGRPIIQFPQDIIAMQELIWRTRPELIVETGVARGGSLIFYASMLELLGNGSVVGIDIDIRPQNRVEIEKHPMAHRIAMLDGSSIDQAIVDSVRRHADGRGSVLVVLDSMHTHDHVLRELELYSPFVRKGGYLVVFDTIIEDMPTSFSEGRPWGPGNSPKTAVREFLAESARFEVDQEIENKLLISVAPGGYLKCVMD